MTTEVATFAGQNPESARSFLKLAVANTSQNAKWASGMLAAFIIKNRLSDPAGLRDFSEAGYRYSRCESTLLTPVFLRKQTYSKILSRPLQGAVL